MQDSSSSRTLVTCDYPLDNRRNCKRKVRVSGVDQRPNDLIRCYQHKGCPEIQFCSICQSNVYGRENSATTDCNHTFHESCLLRWVATQFPVAIPVSCPVCRAAITNVYSMAQHFSMMPMLQLEQRTGDDIVAASDQMQNDRDRMLRVVINQWLTDALSIADDLESFALHLGNLDSALARHVVRDTCEKLKLSLTEWPNCPLLLINRGSDQETTASF